MGNEPALARTIWACVLNASKRAAGLLSHLTSNGKKYHQKSDIVERPHCPAPTSHEPGHQSFSVSFDYWILHPFGKHICKRNCEVFIVGVRKTQGAGLRAIHGNRLIVSEPNLHKAGTVNRGFVLQEDGRDTTKNPTSIVCFQAWRCKHFNGSTWSGVKSSSSDGLASIINLRQARYGARVATNSSTKRSKREMLGFASVGHKVQSETGRFANRTSGTERQPVPSLLKTEHRLEKHSAHVCRNQKCAVISASDAACTSSTFAFPDSESRSVAASTNVYKFATNAFGSERSLRTSECMNRYFKRRRAAVTLTSVSSSTAFVPDTAASVASDSNGLEALSSAEAKEDTVVWSSVCSRGACQTKRAETVSTQVRSGCDGEVQASMYRLIACCHESTER